MIVEFIDQMRTHEYAVESVILVLREQGVEITARTYRAWRRGRVSSRTVTDAMVVDAVRDTAWTTVTLPDGTTKRKMTPEGSHGRRRMTAHIRRTRLASASWGAVDRAMRLLGLEGVRRSKEVRTTIPSIDGVRAGDLLNRDFTAPRPDHTWVMDFTYVRSWRIPAVVATVDTYAGSSKAAIRSAGVSQPNDFRGRPFSSSAIMASCSNVNWRRSAPLGRY